MTRSRTQGRFGLLLTTLLLVWTGCRTDDSAGAGKRPGGAVDDEGRLPVVYAVNYPLQYFANRIGGGAVEVVLPDIQGDPAYWEPDPEQVAAYQDADLILLNGAGYAEWTTRVSLPSSRIVNTGSGLEERFIARDDLVTHTHGPGGKHTHGRLAFTTWLDPTLAIEQARAIEQAFSRTWPGKAADFERGLNELVSDLNELDASLESVTGRLDEPLVMSHPVYQYLERRYNLDARSVHFEPDVVPDEGMIEGLRHLLSHHAAKWMIWEAQPTAESVEILEGLGLKHAVFDPCGNRPAAGDYLEVMRRNVAELGEIVRTN